MVTRPTSSKAFQRHCDLVPAKRRQRPRRIVPEKFPGHAGVHHEPIQLHLLRQGPGSRRRVFAIPAARILLHCEDCGGPLDDPHAWICWAWRLAMPVRRQDELHVVAAAAVVFGHDRRGHGYGLLPLVLRRAEDPDEASQASESLVLVGACRADVHGGGRPVAADVVARHLLEELVARLLRLDPPEGLAHWPLHKPREPCTAGQRKETEKPLLSA